MLAATKEQLAKDLQSATETLRYHEKTRNLYDTGKVTQDQLDALVEHK
ncbi:hypothetical protein GQF01_02000 [Paenibacillus sp. 5J-6]|uniref:Uncharacterized protein n=1 Tax=Paenibacillus silvestris TaxID=2606219 RepID=A0A6L8UU97_9BACL|nr:hypothetical protein [Paenibacillus silvestris]MZQ80912.1 hypothetical protein [Paenibacillus silvestris]